MFSAWEIAAIVFSGIAVIALLGHGIVMITRCIRNRQEDERYLPEQVTRSASGWGDWAPRQDSQSLYNLNFDALDAERAASRASEKNNNKGGAEAGLESDHVLDSTQDRLELGITPRTHLELTALREKMNEMIANSQALENNSSISKSSKREPHPPLKYDNDSISSSSSRRSTTQRRRHGRQGEPGQKGESSDSDLSGRRSHSSGSRSRRHRRTGSKGPRRRRLSASGSPGAAPGDDGSREKRRRRRRRRRDGEKDEHTSSRDSSRRRRRRRRDDEHRRRGSAASDDAVLMHQRSDSSLKNTERGSSSIHSGRHDSHRNRRSKGSRRSNPTSSSQNNDAFTSSAPATPLWPYEMDDMMPTTGIHGPTLVSDTESQSSAVGIRIHEGTGRMAEMLNTARQQSMNFEFKQVSPSNYQSQRNVEESISALRSSNEAFMARVRELQQKQKVIESLDKVKKNDDPFADRSRAAVTSVSKGGETSPSAPNPMDDIQDFKNMMRVARSNSKSMNITFSKDDLESETY